MESHTPVTSTTYTVPLDHFTGTTSNVITVSDQLLVGSHSILPLHLANSTMVPQATPVSAGNTVITQAPIGTPLPLRSNPSLPPGYNALNTSIANPTQNPSRGSNLFVPPGYNVASHFVPTPTQVLSGGLTFLLHLHLEDLIILALVAPIKLEAQVILSLLVFKFLLEVNLKLGGNLKFIKLEAIT
jgi:hypothetical protein